MNPELKHNTGSQVSFTITNAGTIGTLVNPILGTNESERIGQDIQLLYMNMKYRILWNTASTASIMSIWIIRDTQQVPDTTPVLSDFLQTTAVDGLPNWLNRKRFVILDKKTYCQDQDKFVVMSEFTQSLNSRCSFNGAAASDIQKNGIYFVAVSNQGINTPTLVITKRTVYTDC